ncbi:gluconeogenesis factor YvcK family protein [Proteocatella sphenisci]|uniref:gluconeogenesis factor YvcK family protein n=1 Tax=Proteocatella sphenisci TaxID=181070 RepID=UPI0004B8C5AE|nr:gluconeogenesis factor YvcK family protein [Proteocatella sphenisci]
MDNKDLNIVVLGGGTGQGNLLRGLKKHTKSLSAIVTVADDGGGSGLIRAENRMLPPGDIRNCLVSLSDMDPIMEKLMDHRFESGSLKNQSFGNLFLLALYEIFGDFEKAVDHISGMIGVNGCVIPSTNEQIRLVAKLDNGSVAIGESNIAPTCITEKTFIKKLELIPSKPGASKKAIEKISEAEIIVIGPGSLYTSIIANLIIPEISEAIIKSKAKKVFICNIMSEEGETDRLDSYGHLEKIIDHVKTIKIDYMLINNKMIDNVILERYDKENKHPVYADDEQRVKIQELGVQIIEDNLLKVSGTGQIVHDSEKVAKILLDIL